MNQYNNSYDVMRYYYGRTGILFEISTFYCISGNTTYDLYHITKYNVSFIPRFLLYSDS